MTLMVVPPVWPMSHPWMMNASPNTHREPGEAIITVKSFEIGKLANFSQKKLPRARWRWVTKESNLFKLYSRLTVIICVSSAFTKTLIVENHYFPR